MAVQRTSPSGRAESAANDTVTGSTKATSQTLSRKEFLRTLGVDVDAEEQEGKPIVIDEFGKLYQFKMFLLKKTKVI